SAINSTLSWFNGRDQILLAQLRGAGLFPSIDAPVMNQPGGPLVAGESLRMFASAGQIYYTIDGSDPRLVGGEIAPTAIPYNGGTITAVDLVRPGPSGTAWRYLDDGSNQGTAWRGNTFDDRSWRGPARGQFGYGDGDENTIVSF